MLKLLFFIVVMFAVGILLEKYLYKRFHIKKQEGMIYKGVNRIHTIGEIMIVLLFIFGMLLNLYYIEVAQFPIWLFIVFYIVFYGFRVFMEWKYIRSTNRYILSINTLVCFVLFISIMYVLIKRVL